MKRTIQKGCALLLALALVFPGAVAGAVSADVAGGVIRLGGEGNDGINCLLPLSNGNLLVSLGSNGHGGSALYPAGVRKVWLLCLSPDGSVVWEQDFGEEEGSSSLRFISGEENGAVLCRYAQSVEDSTRFTQLRRYATADGALLWEGEREVNERAEDDLGGTDVHLRRMGTRCLRETIMDSGRTTRPRYYQLENSDGTALWQVNDSQTIGSLYMPYETPLGTLLLGATWDEDAGCSFAAAALISEAGKIVWRQVYTGIGDSTMERGALAPNGRFAVLGLVREKKPEEFTVDSLMAMLNLADGELVWHRRCGAEEVRMDEIAAVENGFLLCGNSRDWTCNAFVLTDENGNEQRAWTERPIGEATYFGARPFLWNGELWGECLASQNDKMDGILVRLKAR